MCAPPARRVSVLLLGSSYFIFTVCVYRLLANVFLFFCFLLLGLSLFVFSACVPRLIAMFYFLVRPTSFYKIIFVPHLLAKFFLLDHSTSFLQSECLPCSQSFTPWFVSLRFSGHYYPGMMSRVHAVNRSQRHGAFTKDPGFYWQLAALAERYRGHNAELHVTYIKCRKKKERMKDGTTTTTTTPVSYTHLTLPTSSTV